MAFDLPNIDIMGGIMGGSPSYQGPQASVGDANPAYKESKNFSPQAYAAQQMLEARKAQNMGPSAGMLKSQEGAMGMKNDAQLSAIQGKQKNYFEAGMKDAGLAAQLKGLNKDQELRQRAFDHVSRVNNVTQEMYKRKLAEETNKQAARNQVLGTVLGAAGSIGGALVGGPVGAAAGGQIGGMIAGGQGEMSPVGMGSQQTMMA